VIDVNLTPDLYDERAGERPRAVTEDQREDEALVAGFGQQVDVATHDVGRQDISKSGKITKVRKDKALALLIGAALHEARSTHAQRVMTWRMKSSKKRTCSGPEETTALKKGPEGCVSTTRPK